MPILGRDVTLPVFMCVEEDASRKIEVLLSEKNLKFNRYLIITGQSPLSQIAEGIAGTLTGTTSLFTLEESTIHEVERVKNEIERFTPEVILGVGGGVVLDVSKYAASEKAVGFISIPTAVSNDGIASPVSVINFNGKTRSLNVHMPMAVVADLNIIKQSPASTLRSGIGDLVSNLSACADWRLAYKKGKEQIDDFTETISRNSAVRIVEAGNRTISDIEFLKVLIEGLIMSGIAMGIYGSSRPCSGSEHMISHAIDHLYQKSSSHGEQVGLATLFTQHLQAIQNHQIKPLFKTFGLPQTPEALNISKQEFINAVSKAPTMRPGRYSILNEVNKPAMEQAYHEVFE
jgi:glycerol-1-phosphate dehydrogenase [NAD(P)+]